MGHQHDLSHKDRACPDVDCGNRGDVSDGAGVVSAQSIVERLREFDNFICGKGSLDGLHFGEPKKLYGRQAMFWWRRSSPITEAADTIESLRRALFDLRYAHKPSEYDAAVKQADEVIAKVQL